jgi:hypothetical protein
MRCGRCRFCARSVERVAQALADPNHFGLRPERSTADTIEQCFRVSRKTCRLCRGKDQRVSEIDMQSTA